MKERNVKSFRQIQEAWVLREQTLVIAELALGVRLPRVPTTIDVYQPTTAFLKFFMDGVETGLPALQNFCLAIANPAGQVQLVPQSPNLTDNQSHILQPIAEEPEHPSPKFALQFTPSSDRSLYVSPSPSSDIRQGSIASSAAKEAALTLSTFYGSVSSDDSADLTGAWTAEQENHDEDADGLFDQYLGGENQAERSMTTNTLGAALNMSGGSSADEDSIFAGLQADE